MYALWRESLYFQEGSARGRENARLGRLAKVSDGVVPGVLPVATVLHRELLRV